ncbi:hypothetical protein GCM10023310_66440 [Paenibacillus vulneris]
MIHERRASETHTDRKAVRIGPKPDLTARRTISQTVDCSREWFNGTNRQPPK